MAKDLPVEADRFGATMEQLLGDLAKEVEAGSGRAVRKSAQVGRREVKANSPERKGSERHYKEGWNYRVRKTHEGWSAVIGNSLKPGLAHLLEKGHAKVGGGRVEPSPRGGHIAPAADKAFEELIGQVRKEVDSL